MRRTRWVRLAIGVALLTALLATTVQAAEIRGAETIIIGRNELIDDDTYLAADTIIVEGTINGDLIAAANRIELYGTVNGDVVAAARTIIVKGVVDDDLRMAGQVLLLQPQAQVGDDLVAAGASLEQQVGSSIAGSVLFGGAQALLAGRVAENVRAGAAALELRGTVAGNMDVVVGGDADSSPTVWMPQTEQPAPQLQAGLTLADGARIGGKLQYEAPRDATINPQAQVAQGIVKTSPTNTNAETAPPVAPAQATLWRLLRQFATLLLVAALLLWAAPCWLRQRAESVAVRPFHKLGWGLLLMLLVVGLVLTVLCGSIVLAIAFGILTLGGLVGAVLAIGFVLEGALLVAFAVLSSAVAPIIVGLATGLWLLRRTRSRWNESPVIPLLVGLALLVLLNALPVIGGLVYALAILLGLGTLWTWGQSLRRNEAQGLRAPETPSSVPT
jgi:cytoskeletal protein CcmA (bactofilin family)